MKARRHLIIFGIFLIQSLSFAGKESGGGNPYLSDFRNRARYIVSKEAQGLLKVDELNKFNSFVERDQPIAASGRLIHPQKGEVVAKVVFNGSLTKEDQASLYPTTIEWLKLQPDGKRFLLLDIEKWMVNVNSVVNGSKSLDLLQFVFHEYLQLSGFDDANESNSSKLRLSEEGYQVWKTEQLEIELNKTVNQNIQYSEGLYGEPIAILGNLENAKKLAIESHARKCEKWKKFVDNLYGNRIVLRTCGSSVARSERSFSADFGFKTNSDLTLIGLSYARIILKPASIRTINVEETILSEVVTFNLYSSDATNIKKAIATWNNACEQWKNDILKDSKVAPLFLSCGPEVNLTQLLFDYKVLKFILQSTGVAVFPAE